MDTQERQCRVSWGNDGEKQNTATPRANPKPDLLRKSKRAPTMSKLL